MATRSPFRANRIGLSLVKLKQVILFEDSIKLEIQGGDFVDQTPVLDIKPYLEYCDRPDDYKSAHWPDQITSKALNVKFCETILQKYDSDFLNSVTEVLKLDPRPQYQIQTEREYGLCYSKHNIRFRAKGHDIEVFEIEDPIS